MGICCLIFCAVCVSLTGKGGSTVYLGESKLALHYFTSLGFRCGEHQNPTDFMLDVIGGEVPRAGQPDFRPQVCACTAHSYAHQNPTNSSCWVRGYGTQIAAIHADSYIPYPHIRLQKTPKSSQYYFKFFKKNNLFFFSYALRICLLCGSKTDTNTAHASQQLLPTSITRVSIVTWACLLWPCMPTCKITRKPFLYFAHNKCLPLMRIVKLAHGSNSFSLLSFMVYFLCSYLSPCTWDRKQDARSLVLCLALELCACLFSLVV